MIMETFLGIPLLIYAVFGIAILLIVWLCSIDSQMTTMNYTAYLVVATIMSAAGYWSFRVGRLNQSFARHFPHHASVYDDIMSCYLISLFATTVVVYALSFAQEAWSARRLHQANTH